MPAQLSSELDHVLAEIELPERINLQEATQSLNNHIEIESVLPAPSAGEQIFITLNPEGAITVTTSIKIPNLKFKLGDLLLETLSSTVAMSGALDKPLAMLLVGIRFLQKLRQLATLEVGMQEAELLLIIYKLTHEGDIPTVDRLVALIGNKLSETQIGQSLETLEKLACIGLTMDGIVLNEAIIVKKN